MSVKTLYLIPFEGVALIPAKISNPLQLLTDLVCQILITAFYCDFDISCYFIMNCGNASSFEESIDVGVFL